MKQALLLTLVVALVLMSFGSAVARGQIRRDPNGVNVNVQGATTVFITFGGLRDQVPVEATWCGELIPAAPDIGFRCDPSTIFGRLPIRFDQSRLSADQRVFTDIMSIPPSVARRAYQAAVAGQTSTFFYVRRFVSNSGGPDEYVFVTCRLTGGGARTPLALLDVQLAFADDLDVLSVSQGATVPALTAEIAYNGTGRLQGRWEIVLPGEDPPTSEDLLTEATLPPDRRALQRRYTQIERFNVFLPPTGSVTLEGPSPERLPTESEGLYQVLLRIEASNDKEGDSNLANAGAGQGVVHSGAVAGFPMPVLRYYVGAVGEDVGRAPGLGLVSPAEGAELEPGATVFSWNLARDAALYRLEIEDDSGQQLYTAVLQQGIGSYRAPAWLEQRLTQASSPELRWRIVALATGGKKLGQTEWRNLQRKEN